MAQYVVARLEVKRSRVRFPPAKNRFCFFIGYCKMPNESQSEMNAEKLRGIFQEMSQLKKELRSAISERDEKDMHLTELRERIKEIEMLNDVQTALADSHKMMQRERETREQYEKEKKQMEKKHNIRVNQLVQETMNARWEKEGKNRGREVLEMK